MTATALLTVLLALSSKVDLAWERLPSLPDQEGFAGMFAGVSNSTLLVAGGANFPDKKPWNGGKKVWYDTVFALKPDSKWEVVGKLPRPLAYGVSVSHRGGVVCVGGSDATKHYADCFRLELRAGKLVTTDLPRLPLPIANACGVLIGDTVFVAGGLEKPDATEALKTLFTLDLSAKEPAWEKRDAWPGPARMLAVAAECDGAFWLIGGTDLIANKDGQSERRYLKDAHRYDLGKGWKKLAELPRAVVGAPSPAPIAFGGPVILGGDDGTQLAVQPDKHRGFAKQVLRYDRKAEKWIEDGELRSPHVTTPFVIWKDMWVIPSGEVRPGVRSPEVWFTQAPRE